MGETHNHSHIRKRNHATLSFSALIIAQLTLATEFDASGLREPPKWLDKASTVRFSMSGEHQNALQTAR